MIEIFRKKSKEQTLQKEYDKLMQEWFRLSSINRSQSDAKYAEAQGVVNKIERLKSNSL